jgi:uncharacterized protein (DUF362 family)
MHPAQDARVILRHVNGYDVEAIRRVVREGMEELGLRPFGRTLVKPNLVCAGPLFEHAHTRPEFVEGVLLALRDRDDGHVQEIGVGERCGITIPSRYAFRMAGIDPVLERTGARRYLFDEVQQVRIEQSHARRLRDYLYVPEPIARADFFVNCPKFKSHPWTTVTFSMKNYIGIQDDRHRMIDHDHALGRKILDLQHVIQPQLVAVDCIIAGEGRMLTPIPRTMNLVILGNNQVALDAVCSRILGLEPASVEHIRLAFEDGFGPLEPEKIRISGDVSLAEARARAEGFQVGLVRVEKYFEGTQLSAYAGPPPGHPPDGYCWGGCPGALEEAIEVLRLFDPGCDTRMPRLHFVFGAYKGPLDVSYGEKVIFVGDCVEHASRIGEKLVQIRSRYRDRSTLIPEQAEHEDIYSKIVEVARRVHKARHEPYLRLDGCPVSVAELILVLSELGGAKNPYFSPKEVLRFNAAYVAQRAAKLAGWARGEAYLAPPGGERGAAEPVLGSAAFNARSGAENR